MSLKRTTIALIPIERQIVTVRGVRVIIDDSLATIYGVSTKRLNEQVSVTAIVFPRISVFNLRGES
jgi:hypothetical protein